MICGIISKKTVLTEIIIETTSQSATWSPLSVIKTGDILRWEVSGGATGTYFANDPTIDLTANTGVAIIKIISTDGYAGVATLRLTSLNIIKINVTLAIGLTSLWLSTNQLTEIVGLSDLVNLTDLRINTNQITSLDLRPFTFLTAPIISSNQFTSVNVTGRTNLLNLSPNSNPNLTSITGLSTATALTTLNIAACDFSTLDVDALTSLQILNFSSNNISVIDISNNTSLTTLTASSNDLTDIDTSNNTLLRNINFFNNQLSQSAVNRLILDADSRGFSSGTRILTYSGGSNASPSRTENTTDDVLNAYNNLIANGWSVTGSVPS